MPDIVTAADRVFREPPRGCTRPASYTSAGLLLMSGGLALGCLLVVLYGNFGIVGLYPFFVAFLAHRAMRGRPATRIYVTWAAALMVTFSVWLAFAAGLSIRNLVNIAAAVATVGGIIFLWLPECTIFVSAVRAASDPSEGLLF
ncbi:hypothetical protein [Actinomycetospora termitidis]|uniref:Uncharacterized protein n=1 Tax=Actinomycetospora termitidis TaxID=3053470 RepID=A0ABT7MEZ9_9PSEU|nr:hypothetical protein [Actinomycetospora sp. Odt1-22]MDL5159011.1 hypothetical protein [Actinomycetospora sp. Odt1-22]